MLGCFVETLIGVAEREVGYLEKASNKRLDSKTANAGRKNYTKYARDIDKIENFFNGKKNGFPWCSVFVSWCFVKSFGVSNAKRLLCHPNKSLGAGCIYALGYHKKNGQFESVPRVGDQIFFKNGDGNACHTGLVYKVDDDFVYTIEGNTSSDEGVVENGGCVAKKKYKLNYNRIIGYGRPKYDVRKESNKVTIELTVLKKGAKGEEVKTLQRLLVSLGYDIGKSGADGSFGGATEKAVKKFQTDKKLEVDGSVGKKTWEKILGVV